MLKYVDTKVTFSEVPNEISLCINISGCNIGCKNCHSPYLSEDIGEPLTKDALCSLIGSNKGITCVTLMGGDSNPKEIDALASTVKLTSNMSLLTCWYSGKQELNKDINLANFNFIKLGPYIEELGSLTSSTTNQRFYEVVMTREIVNNEPVYGLEDITYKFWR